MDNWQVVVKGEYREETNYIHSQTLRFSSLFPSKVLTTLFWVSDALLTWNRAVWFADLK